MVIIIKLLSYLYFFPTAVGGHHSTQITPAKVQTHLWLIQKISFNLYLSQLSAPFDLFSHFLFLFSCGIILVVVARSFSEFSWTLASPLQQGLTSYSSELASTLLALVQAFSFHATNSASALYLQGKDSLLRTRQVIKLFAQQLYPDIPLTAVFRTKSNILLGKSVSPPIFQSLG